MKRFIKFFNFRPNLLVFKTDEDLTHDTSYIPHILLGS